MTLADRTLFCNECGQSFVFSAGEQELLAMRGAEGAPARCPRCRRPPGPILKRTDRAVAG